MLCECFLYMGKSLFVFKLRFLGIQKLNINILLTSSFINPEVQRINSQGNLIQLLADICKVFDFIVGDLTVSGDLDQTAGERVDLIKTSDGFQDNGRKLGNLDTGPRSYTCENSNNCISQDAYSSQPSG